MSTGDAAHRVLAMYFAAALADAGSWRGSKEQVADVERAWLRWRAEERLAPVTAMQALLWATNRAASAPAWMFAQALDDRTALVHWLRERGYTTAARADS